MLYDTKKTIKWTETIFDFLYLLTIWCYAVLLLSSSASTNSLRWQFGGLTILLAIGDTFHLVPRIAAMWISSKTLFSTALGIGKLLSSITMTFFYLGLWHIGSVFYQIENTFLTIIMVVLATIRIFLCLLPQNKWSSLDDETSTLSVWRNIPFLILGISVMILFFIGPNISSANRFNYGISFLWVAILISFACYLPVVLFVKKNPKLGMLMIPKSCAYIAMIIICSNSI